MSYKDIPAVVVDNGSSKIIAGFAGDTSPLVEFPTLVGEVHHSSFMSSSEKYVGEEALQKRGLLKLIYPVADGMIAHWEEMELVWQHMFHKQLQCAPEERAILMTENVMSLSEDRERMAAVLFEKFRVPAFYVSPYAELFLLASGRTSGFVLNSGQKSTQAVPIHDGRVVRPAVRVLHIAGSNISSYLAKILCSRGYGLSDIAGEETIDDVMRNLCYVALDYDQELQKGDAAVEKTYAPPGGQILKVGQDRFKCPEILFQPTLIGVHDQEGMIKLCSASFSSCAGHIQKDMYANIVLSGETTLFPGFADRVRKDIAAAAPPGTQIDVINPSDRKHSAWRGGSLRASDPAFKELWVTKQEYEEVGPSIVQKKCS